MSKGGIGGLRGYQEKKDRRRVVGEMENIMDNSGLFLFYLFILEGLWGKGNMGGKRGTGR